MKLERFLGRAIGIVLVLILFVLLLLLAAWTLKAFAEVT